MSRSKHTDPRAIRAARRLRAPDENRGVGDLSRRRQLGRAFKLVAAVPAESQQHSQVPIRPRIIIRRPRPGFYHPLSKSDILKLLEEVGSVAAYGLRCIELVHSPPKRSHGVRRFGRYEVPGRIVLYEQPLSPWRLSRLPRSTIRQFEAAGATVTTLPNAGASLVHWPGNTLHRFMLEQVLLHEIGHHLLQHHKGKRLIRVARSRDHEAFASQFARNQRRALRKPTL